MTNLSSSTGIKKNFFISYTSIDTQIAEWIAWTLEKKGYSVVFQKWDFPAGTSIIGNIHHAAIECERTLAVLSPDYFTSRYTTAEWEAAVKKDPDGTLGLLVPVIVRTCKIDGLLGRLAYSSILNLTEKQAKTALLQAVKSERAKPKLKPAYPSVSGRNKPQLKPAYLLTKPSVNGHTKDLPPLDDELTKKEIPVEYIYFTDTHQPNEAFAIELLNKPIVLRKDNSGDFTVTINRSGVEKAVITNAAKKEVCKKYINHQLTEIKNKDVEIFNFLNGKTNEQDKVIYLDKFPLRWASGGVFSVVKYRGQTWTPFFFRDIPPYGWNISLGASERHFYNQKVQVTVKKELNNPKKLAIREFLEETLIFDRKPIASGHTGINNLVIDLGNIKIARKKARSFAKMHIKYREEYDQIFIDHKLLKESDSYNNCVDINVKFLSTNTNLQINPGIGNRSNFNPDVLVCFNLFELGIEIVKIAQFDLYDDYYLLDGEIIEETKELARMPFALISHDYLWKNFGENYEIKYPEKDDDLLQCSFEGNHIPLKDIHVFHWDVRRRVEIMRGAPGIGGEKGRYTKWYDKFGKNFLDGNDEPSDANPSLLFTPASVKIVHSYFLNYPYDKKD